MASGQSSSCEALRTRVQIPSTYTNSRWGNGQPLSSTCIHTYDCIFMYTCASTHANTQLHTHSYHTYVCKEKNSWESSRVRARRLWYWCQSVKAKLISFCRCFSKVSLHWAEESQTVLESTLLLLLLAWYVSIPCICKWILCTQYGDKRSGLSIIPK